MLNIHVIISTVLSLKKYFSHSQCSKYGTFESCECANNLLLYNLNLNLVGFFTVNGSWTNHWVVCLKAERFKLLSLCNFCEMSICCIVEW